jgi:DNA repair protein RecN (Recombination protein N)
VIRSVEIRDLVVIDRAELQPAAGLTAITGETGAGKSVVAGALALLLGAPADQRAVRPGARHALVQAALALPPGFWDSLDEEDPALGLRELAEDESEVVVGRRVPAEGRARALLDGAAASTEAVAGLAGARLRIVGQGEGRRLTGAAAQLAALDAFAGPEARGRADRVASLRRRARAAGRALAAARGRREAAGRQRAALEELVREVEDARPDPAEEGSLLAERERLRGAERLLAAAAAAARALSPDDAEGAGAIGQVGAAIGALEGALALDPALGAPLGELAGAQDALQEASMALHRYLEGLAGDAGEPGRLDRVEERLEAYRRITRRHGGVEEALARAAEARAALAALEGEAAGEDALAAQRARLLADLRDEADALHAVRAEAAPRLGAAVARELSELGMPAAALRVELAAAPVEDPDEAPADRAALWLRANPGLAEAPLASAASGGELSRVLLALQAAGTGAAAADGAARALEGALVFDEVDAGIGGETATALALKLAALARGRQVLVITHLPQVAAMADVHYRLVKGPGAGGLASTAILSVEGEELVAELCRMLGAAPSDRGARRHAEELLARRATP